MQYLIRSLVERDDETGEPLFWSNDDGWVDRKSATIFTEPERERFAPLIDSEWVVTYEAELSSMLRGMEISVEDDPEFEGFFSVYCDRDGSGAELAGKIGERSVAEAIAAALRSFT